MFELWARKWPVDGNGFPYELIERFEREDLKFYMADKLDRSIYKEAMVLDGNHNSIFFREFEKPTVKKLGTIPNKEQ